MKAKLFTDILKEADKTGILKYSQGRVYLFVSIVAYYLTLGIITYKSYVPKSDISLETLKVIIGALQYAMVLFGGYVFGGKFLDVVKVIGGKKDETPVQPTPPAQPAQPAVQPQN